MRFALAVELHEDARMARVAKPGEQEALDVICALENVRSFEWLEEGTGYRVRTPDFRLELAEGRSVLVEVTMATSQETRELLPVDGYEFESDELACWWKVRVAHRHSTGAEPGISPKIKQLLPLLVPILSDIESQGEPPDAILQWAERRLHQKMRVIDQDTEAIYRRVVRVTEIIPVENGKKGGIHASVSIGSGLMPESVDNLVSAIQESIDKKREHGQDADWLAVAIDRIDAWEQIHEAFGGGSDSSIDGAQDLRCLDLRGYEEVWVFACSPEVPGHVVLRFSGSGANWTRSVVEQVFN